MGEQWVKVKSRTEEKRAGSSSQSKHSLHVKFDPESKEKSVAAFLTNFKTQPCPKEKKATYHDYRVCPCYHSMNDRRRNPYEELYDVTEVQCTPMEQMYHPTKYKTFLCEDPANCIFGEFCAKAHTDEELRDREDAEFKFALKMSAQSSSGPKPSHLLDFYSEKVSSTSRQRRHKDSNLPHHTAHHPEPWQKDLIGQTSEFSSKDHSLNKKSIHWFMIKSSKIFREHIENIALEEGLCRLRIQATSWDVNHNPVITVEGLDADSAMERILRALKYPPDRLFTFRKLDCMSDRVRKQLEDALESGRLIPQKYKDLICIEIHGSTITACVLGSSGAGMEVIFEKINFWVKQEKYDKFLKCYCCLAGRNADEGIECSCGEFICSTGDCFDEFVKSQILGLQGQGGKILCPFCQREISLRVVAEHLGDGSDTWARLHKAIVDKEVKKEYKVLQSSFDKMLEQKINELIQNYSDDIGMKKEKAKLNAARARNEALNLKCPHCTTVYADFEGCMALKCSMCSLYFCGFCHSKMSTSAGAHEHVRNCLLNETKNGSYYASAEEIKQAQRRYRTREIKKFLQQFKKEEQNATIIELTDDLNDLGIDPASLFEFGSALRDLDNEYI